MWGHIGFYFVLGLRESLIKSEPQIILEKIIRIWLILVYSIWSSNSMLCCCPQDGGDLISVSATCQQTLCYMFIRKYKGIIPVAKCCQDKAAMNRKTALEGSQEPDEWHPSPFVVLVWVTVIENCGSRRGLLRGKGHKKRVEQRTSYSKLRK